MCCKNAGSGMRRFSGALICRLGSWGLNEAMRGGVWVEAITALLPGDIMVCICGY